METLTIAISGKSLSEIAQRINEIIGNEIADGCNADYVVCTDTVQTGTPNEIVYESLVTFKIYEPRTD